MADNGEHDDHELVDYDEEEVSWKKTFILC